jgi:hypothetical protein
MLSFDGERILKDAMTELFGTNQPIDVEKLKKTLWEMSGEYLLRTGDRDLVTQRTYLDTFFIQSNNPSLMVKALMKKS